MATEYDSGILQAFADRLYSDANWVIITTTVKYGVLGFLVAFIGAAVYARLPVSSGTDPGLTQAFIAAVSIIAALIGIAAGREKAFHLKLEAQKILCQVAIEQNTRIQEKANAAGT
jgi:uncharacterized protein involved in response to NO